MSWKLDKCWVQDGRTDAFNRAARLFMFATSLGTGFTQRHLGETQPELICGSWLPSQQVFPGKPRQTLGLFCSSKLLRD